jgi:hypothetical protein
MVLETAFGRFSRQSASRKRIASRSCRVLILSSSKFLIGTQNEDVSSPEVELLVADFGDRVAEGGPFGGVFFEKYRGE